MDLIDLFNEVIYRIFDYINMVFHVRDGSTLTLFIVTIFPILLAIYINVFPIKRLKTFYKGSDFSKVSKETFKYSKRIYGLYLVIFNFIYFVVVSLISVLIHRPQLFNTGTPVCTMIFFVFYIIPSMIEIKVKNKFKLDR